jgi:hypothetical protein
MPGLPRNRSHQSTYASNRQASVRVAAISHRRSAPFAHSTSGDSTPNFDVRVRIASGRMPVSASRRMRLVLMPSKFVSEGSANANVTSGQSRKGERTSSPPCPSSVTITPFARIVRYRKAVRTLRREWTRAAGPLARCT